MRKLGIAISAAVLLAAAILSKPPDASAFCGFYVGKADTSLYNHASQVAIVHDGDRTVISMMNDYQGEPSEFALVVPVPTVLRREQIHVGDRELFTKLDEYSSPRLVEYTDPDPCPMRELQSMRFGGLGKATSAPMAEMMPAPQSNRLLGVTVEAQYTVGEYDILLLSAEQSDGLETWLQQNGYKVPFGAHRALQPYIHQKMKFFVAKVNLNEHAKTGLSYLRPLQFAFESPKFMLPIRLGMINAQGPQDLVIYVMTRTGRVETTNYRNIKVPTGMSLPEYVQSDFGDVYKAIFSRQASSNELRAVFTEYVWNMSSCDPCAGQPLSPEELRQLGVFWIQPGPQPGNYMPPGLSYQSSDVMLTRLHVRYTADTFPEDLVFQQTGDTESYQARYVLHHPWQGSPEECPEARSYFSELNSRRTVEAETLADLTGWDVGGIMKKVGLSGSGDPQQWWQKLW